MNNKGNWRRAVGRDTMRSRLHDETAGNRGYAEDDGRTSERRQVCSDCDEVQQWRGHPRKTCEFCGGIDLTLEIHYRDPYTGEPSEVTDRKRIDGYHLGNFR